MNSTLDFQLVFEIWRFCDLFSFELALLNCQIILGKVTFALLDYKTLWIWLFSFTLGWNRSVIIGYWFWSKICERGLDGIKNKDERKSITWIGEQIFIFSSVWLEVEFLSLLMQVLSVLGLRAGQSKTEASVSILSICHIVRFIFQCLYQNIHFNVHTSK